MRLESERHEREEAARREAERQEAERQATLRQEAELQAKLRQEAMAKLEKEKLEAKVGTLGLGD